MFLQVYEQAKDVDVSFFRIERVVNEPHVSFKVDFKGELVQGIAGPYRQFFSDISAELQPKDMKVKKTLKLLIPSKNNQDQKGDFKDKYVIYEKDELKILRYLLALKYLNSSLELFKKIIVIKKKKSSGIDFAKNLI